MPPPSKHALPVASTSLAKRAKPAVKKPVTRVPKWGRALTDVVVAFEACDQEELMKALDDADPALLNHIPTLPHDLSLDHPDASRWFRDNCFFNASTEFGLGTRPLSLVSSAVYMLAHTWGKRHALARATKYHRDEWVSVFQTLIAHKKIDLNAYSTVCENPKWEAGVYTSSPNVTYIPGTVSREPSSPDIVCSPPRWSARTMGATSGRLRVVSQQQPLCATTLVPSGAQPYVDDAMRPLDYACLIRDQERRTENGAYARNLVSILVQSGNFAPTARDLKDLFLRALFSLISPACAGPTAASNQDDDKHMRLVLDDCDFLKALRRADLLLMRGLFRYLKHEGRHLQWPNHPWNRPIWYLRSHMSGRRTVLRRQQLLGCVRWVARGHILASRWWAGARERSYKPGGDGCLRARLSYEAAAAAAADGP